MGCNQVAAVQYTFTHKEYTERHKTNNTQNNTKQTIHRTTQNKQYIEQHKNFLDSFFRKYSNTKFHENLSSGSRVVPCGRTDRRTDRHDEDNSRFSQFCESA